MIALFALTLAVQDAASGRCLLAGPSGSLVLIGIERISPGKDEYLIRPLKGQAWPFDASEILVRNAGPGGGGVWLEGADAKRKLSVGFSTSFKKNGVIGVVVYRGGERRQRLPLLAGSCPQPESPDRYPLALVASAGKSAARPASFWSARLEASLSCQVASASGWASSFTIALGKDGSTVTLTPVGAAFFGTAPVVVRRVDPPPFPQPEGDAQVRSYGIGFSDAALGGIDTLWVNTAKDGQSSVEASFFGYTSTDTGIEENLLGICADSVGADAK